MNTSIQPILRTRARDWAPLFLRLGVGTVMIAHGGQKLFGWWGGYGLEGTAGFFAGTVGLSPGILWAALVGGTEFFGGFALLAGFATRLAAGAFAATMAGAIIMVHRGAFFMPDGIEFAWTLLFASLALVLTGGGAASIDGRLAPQTPAKA